MVVGRPLEPRERLASQRRFNAFNFGNGVSYMCLGENLLVLFAARLDAPNAVVALLGAMLYIGYAMLPLGVRRTALRGAADCQADFWIARNAAALLTASAALVWRVSPPASWCVLLLGSFLFYGCRAAGSVLSIPLLGDISTEEEAPGVIGRTTAAFNVSGVATLAVIATITRRHAGLGILAGIIVFGALFGMASTLVLRGLRETGAIRDAARAPLRRGMREAMREPDLRRLSAAWFALNLALILAMPLSMLALKRGCGLGDSEALLCACSQYIGGIAVSFASGRLCRVLGPRRVLVATSVGCAAVPAAWMLFPAAGGAALPCGLALFFWIGAVFYLVQNGASSYFLLACPDKGGQVAGSVAVNLAAGVGAGVAGSAAGAWLISRAADLAPTLGAAAFAGALGPFRLYFLLILPAIALALVASLRLRTKVYAYRETHGEDALRRAIATAHHRPH